ncbi:endonuclease [Aequorivita sp. Q41]|uniref:endonuclease/exonuclease/phosphatase family protein n=1 Tax=Aequorivita sp. Q41 TaxID=3153300 RepID=UPI00324275C7
MKNLYSVAFYNLENLFDTVNDSKVMDDDFTPGTQMDWSAARYSKKLNELGRIISQIGYKETNHPPVIIGVAEVENETVLKDLVSTKFLKSEGYGYIHFDSPDERGIDTALIYRKKYFKILYKEAITLLVYNEEGIRDYTRDILYVKGKLEDEIIHILINHWPSRREGTEITTPKRMAAALKNREIISKIKAENPLEKIIVMGDFNDNPTNESLKTLADTDFYNPMEMLLTKYSGSLNYQSTWNLFDQIIISNSFLQQYKNSFQFEKARIFNPKELKEHEGKFKGNPFRTYAGPHYLGGVSDHFPVFAVFSVKKNNTLNSEKSLA